MQKKINQDKNIVYCIAEKWSEKLICHGTGGVEEKLGKNYWWEAWDFTPCYRPPQPDKEVHEWHSSKYNTLVWLLAYCKR